MRKRADDGGPSGRVSDGQRLAPFRGSAFGRLAIVSGACNNEPMSGLRAANPPMWLMIRAVMPDK